MAGKIKGITIELNGDASGLNKALNSVEKQAKTTETGLKYVDKALKLDPSNVELLEQKQRLLADAVSETAKKLDLLKKAQADAAEQLAKGDTSAQARYDEMTRRIVETEAALKKATKASDEFNASTEQLKAKLDGVATTAGKVADATQMVSMAAAGVVAGIGAMALKAADAADELSTMAKQSGLATDELQKIQYASDRVDVSTEAIVSAQTKLRKSMAGSGEAFKKLAISVKDTDGRMRDSNEVFYETLQRLGTIANETERDQLAMEIFGKSADQLAGIIDDGGAALKAYGEEAERLGIILDQDTLDSMNAVQDKLDQIKAQATGELMKAGAAALEALTPLIDKVVEALSGVLQLIGNMDPKLIEAIAIIASIVASISPIAGIVTKTAHALDGLIELFPDIAKGFSAVTSFAASNPIVLIAAAVAALALLIITHWDEIRPVLEKIWNKVKEIGGKIADFITGAIEPVKSAFGRVRDFFVDTFTAISDGVKEKINAVIGFINTAIEAINTFVEKINASKLGQALGINIGTIGTIDTLPLSSDAGNAILAQSGRGAGAVSNYNTANTYNTYNQTSMQPLQVNMNIDGTRLASQMVQPMRTANAAAGSSNMR